MTSGDVSKLMLTSAIVVVLVSTMLFANTTSNLMHQDMEELDTNNGSFTSSSIVIDGNLSSGEWDDAEHVIAFYIDADPLNADGYNYIYLDEDPENLYLALDLCSDQTNDETGEWLGLWLDTNETIANATGLDETAAWESALDAGLESLVYDVDNNQEIPFFDPLGGTIGDSHQLQSLSEFIPLNGTFTGSLSNVTTWDEGGFVNMTSEYNGSHYIYRLDLELYIPDYQLVFADLFANHTLSLEMMIRTVNNVTLDEHYMSVRTSDGHLNLSDPDQTISINSGTTLNYDYLTAASGNFTDSDYALFSFVGINDAPFNTSFDGIMIENMITNRTNSDATGHTVNYPYTSLKDYTLDWSYGPSENNASDHRTFEIQIPKSELEGYTMDSDLGILLGGYGTLSFDGSNYWVLNTDYYDSIPYRNTTAYFYYSMPMKGWTPPSNPILDEPTPDPDLDGNVLITWNDDASVENWSVYRYSSEITSGNLDTAAEIASGLTVNQYNDTGLSNGTYWYAVVAVDTFGYTYLSNSENVTVEIPNPWVPLDSPVLQDIAPDPDLDGNIWLEWNDDPGVANWTLYRFTTNITSLNLDDALELATGLLVNQYNDTGLANGTYWYAVVAVDAFGYTYLSNSENVTVAIPAAVTTTTTSTTTDTGSTSTETSTPTTGTSTPGSTTPPQDYEGVMMILTVMMWGTLCVVIVIVVYRLTQRR